MRIMYIFMWLLSPSFLVWLLPFLFILCSYVTVIEYCSFAAFLRCCLPSLIGSISYCWRFSCFFLLFSNQRCTNFLAQTNNGKEINRHRPKQWSSGIKYKTIGKCVRVCMRIHGLYAIDISATMELSIGAVALCTLLYYIHRIVLKIALFSYSRSNSLSLSFSSYFYAIINGIKPVNKLDMSSCKEEHRRNIWSGKMEEKIVEPMRIAQRMFIKSNYT